MNWPTNLLHGVPSFLTGGLAGVLITNYLSWRRQRTDLAFKILEQFFARHSELGEVLGLLLQPERLADPMQLNRVLAVGDWFEMVATMCRRGIINSRLIKRMGIHDQMRDFYSAAANAGTSTADAAKAWSEMRNLTHRKGEAHE